MKDTKSNRRTFIKLSAGAAAALAVGGCATTATTTEKEKKAMSNTGDEARVNNEWDKLTKVIVGIPTNPICPEVTYPLEEYKGLSDKVKENFRRSLGKAYDKLEPELWAKTSQQEEGLAKAIAAEGITVVRPEALSVEQAKMAPIGNWQLYSRDSLLAVRPYIIVTSCRMPFRRKERWGNRTVITEIVSNTNQQYISMPDPARGVDLASEDQPYLEGGDVFLLNKDILVGHSGLASSYAGIKWLTKFLKPYGYRVHTIELTKTWLHLDCIFATAREGLMMCTTEGLVDGVKGLPKFLHDWKLIESTYKEAKTLGCNGVNLAPGVTVIGAEHERVIGELDKKKVKCVTVPYESASMNGGGPRCSTHPLQRTPS